MKNGLAVGAAALVLAGTTLTGCGQQSYHEPAYAAICVDKYTHERVPDDYCHHHSVFSHFAWFYMSSHSSHLIPGIGARYYPSYGRYRVPRGSTYQRGGLSKTGGSFSTRKTWGKTATRSGGSSGGGWFKSRSGGSSGSTRSGTSRSGGFSSGSRSGGFSSTRSR